MPAMAHVALLSRGLRLALPSLVAALLGLACAAAPAARAPECPSGRWCGTLAQVDALAQTRERVLTCPMYVGWAEDGAPASTASAVALPPKSDGKIDLEATRARHLAGETDACCYHWFASCPGEKPLAGGRAAPGK
jgi:hypothetical protein